MAGIIAIVKDIIKRRPRFSYSLLFLGTVSVFSLGLAWIFFGIMASVYLGLLQALAFLGLAVAVLLLRYRKNIQALSIQLQQVSEDTITATPSRLNFETDPSFRASATALVRAEAEQIISPIAAELDGVVSLVKSSEVNPKVYDLIERHKKETLEAVDRSEQSSVRDAVAQAINAIEASEERLEMRFEADLKARTSGLDLKMVSLDDSFINFADLADKKFDQLQSAAQVAEQKFSDSNDDIERLDSLYTDLKRRQTKNISSLNLRLSALQSKVASQNLDTVTQADLNEAIHSIRQILEQRLFADVEEYFSAKFEKLEKLSADLESQAKQVDRQRSIVDDVTQSLQSSISKIETNAGDVASISSNIETTQNLLNKTREMSVAIPIATALRIVNSATGADSAVDQLVGTGQTVHGHELIMAVISDRKETYTESAYCRQFIEVGSTRDRIPGQQSSESLAFFCELNKFKFITVDADPLVSNSIRGVLRAISPASLVVNARGEEYLSKQERVDFLYLDAFDISHDNHSEARQRRYRELFDTEINDEDSWAMHLNAVTAALPRLSSNALVCFDDTWQDGKVWAGKGKYALPYLLKYEFDIIAKTDRSVVLGRR